MKKMTLICYYFNEIYLLKYWLLWHRQWFDGIMINYNSDDGSTELIQKLCPSWKIVKPKYNDGFHARDLDREVVDAEKSVKEGWKLCLNVTEFVFHDDFGNYMDSQPQNINGIWLSPIAMVDRADQRDTELDDRPLVLQRPTGQFGCGNVRYTANGRLIHRAEHGNWVGWGRHASSLPNIISPGDAYHLWFGWSPWNKQIIKRKAQIRDKIIDDDMKVMAAGTHMMTVDQLENTFTQFQGSSNTLMDNPKFKEIYEKIEKKYKNIVL